MSMTVSPVERHNYLAIRLSRYRSADPYVFHEGAKDERSWIGSAQPGLEAREGHQFDVHVPGYDLRRRIQAKDPLCCSNAFFVQIRTILPSQASECARIAFIVWNTMIHAKTLLEAVQSWRVALLAEPTLSSEQLRHRNQAAVFTSTSNCLCSAYISTARCKKSLN